MSPIRALLVPVHGAVQIVTLTPDWRAMRDLIGAKYVEHVRIPVVAAAMYVDEDGLFTDKAENRLATGRLYPGIIVGDVILTGEVDTMDGLSPASLTDDQIARLCQLMGVAKPEAVTS